MKGRVAHICSLLPPARVYADVGCDHGYMAKYVLSHGLCEKMYITDLHAGSLKKAERLLEREIDAGKCVPVLCDGLSGVPEPCGFVLIAGMGGEEIAKILERDGIPARFLLQPMKNSDKVRRLLVTGGARIERDYTFSEGDGPRRYYDVILGSASGGDSYSEKEFRFGRDNVRGKSPDFLLEMREELQKTEERLMGRLGERSRAKLEALREEYREIIHEVEGIVRHD